MKKNIFVNVLGTSLLVLCLVTGFISCASTKTVSVENLEYYKSPYYDQFIVMFQANPKDKNMLEVLDKWNAEEPDADMYKSYFIYYFNQAVTEEDNSDIDIPEQYAWIDNPDGSNSIVFRDLTLDIDLFNLAIDYIYQQGVQKYPNRIDLWDVTLRVFNQFDMKENLKTALLSFIGVSKSIGDAGLNWYVDFNNPLVVPKFDEEDSVIRDIIIRNANAIVDNYPEKESPIYYEEIYSTLAELYPNDSYVFNELGYSQFVQSKFSDGLVNYEKAYKLDNTNKTALLNVCIAALVTDNKEKLEVYSKKIYETGDKQLIYSLENQKEVFNKVKK